MSDEELVEKMARKVHADRMKEEPAQYPIGFDDEHSVYTTAVLDLMRSALAVARPIIEREALTRAALSLRGLQYGIKNDFDEGYSDGLAHATLAIHALIDNLD